VQDESGERRYGPTLAESIEDGRRRQSEQAALFRSAPFPLYGLPPSYQGRRYLGGSYAGGKRAVALSLLHGSIDGEEPFVIVETSTLKSGHGGGPMRVLADLCWDRSRMDSSEFEDRLRASQLGTDSLDDVAWTSVAVSVQEVVRPFMLASREQEWVARTEVDGHLVTIEGSAFPLASVELVRIEDLTPYIAGSREYG
jgi:hypothetical protein